MVGFWGIFGGDETSWPSSSRGWSAYTRDKFGSYSPVQCWDSPEPGGGDAAAGTHSGMATSALSSASPTSVSIMAPKMKRILTRDETGAISDGRFNIERTGYPQSRVILTSFFHSLIQMSMTRLVGTFFVMYVTVYGFFGSLWFTVAHVSDECHESLGINTYRDAFHLSLETQQTIGFGVPDPYFSHCTCVTPLLVCQTLCGLLLDMVALNVLYQRFSSPVGRAMTVAFSKVAILRHQDGHENLVFRFCEIRKQPLLDVYVRVYCLQRVENPFVSDGFEFSLVPLEIEEPDGDAAEGRVLSPLPVCVVHRIDKDSPLAPPAEEKDSGDGERRFTVEGLRQSLMARPFLEIIAVVCGTDENSGNTVEARFSYTLEELRWDQVFASCVSIQGDGCLYVDFHALHETVNAPSDDSADGDAK